MAAMHGDFELTACCELTHWLIDQESAANSSHFRHRRWKLFEYRYKTVGRATRCGLMALNTIQDNMTKSQRQ